MRRGDVRGLTPKPDSPEGSEEPEPFDLIERWADLEADFERDYRVDLRVDLARMSLRRFMVLFRGLGPNSLTQTKLANARFIGGAYTPRIPRAPESQTPEQSERILDAMFAGAKVVH